MYFRITSKREFHCEKVVFACLFFLSSLFTESDGQKIVKDSPLRLSGNDLVLKLGTQVNLSLTPTDQFDKIFGNVTVPTVLVFRYPSEGNLQISPLPNVSLVDPRLPSTGSVFTVTSVKAGRLVVTSEIIPTVNNYTAVDIFLRVSVYKLALLNVIATYVGWIYFAAWSISFYPQIYQNFQRKSVRGLSFEFVFLNITGFTVYTMYNVGLFWIPSIQNQYYAKDPTGSIPVQMNDVVFAVHAVFASGITGIQCLIYDRGSQQISYTGRTILCGIGVFIFIMFVITVSNAVTWLFFLNACSYVKLFITLIKYIPQAYLNYTRKSTSGWCIGNVLLDFTGGFFSIIQMFLIAYNHDDWYSIFGDFTKFGLGLFSIIFDILFIFQHYYLYRSHREYEPIEGSSDPVMNPHEDMVTSNHVQSSHDGETGGSSEVAQSNSIDSIIQQARVPSEDDPRTIQQHEG